MLAMTPAFSYGAPPCVGAARAETNSPNSFPGAANSRASVSPLAFSTASSATASICPGPLSSTPRSNSHATEPSV